ncbi:hypothetical protein [Yoonia sp. R2-816]|uniref:hypothetical protein n=1 Tax=Yoonia sp. R2-816 TaxID=3342638 RepID=UPI003728BBB6
MRSLTSGIKASTRQAVWASQIIDGCAQHQEHNQGKAGVVREIAKKERAMLLGVISTIAL